MEEAEFCLRFKKRLIKIACGKFSDRESIADYADEVAPKYFEESTGYDSPEECAEIDLSYWDED